MYASSKNIVEYANILKRFLKTKKAKSIFSFKLNSKFLKLESEDIRSEEDLKRFEEEITEKIKKYYKEGIIALLIFYSIIARFLGKSNKIEINFKKSLIFNFSIILIIFLAFLITVIMYLISFIPIVGPIINTLVKMFVQIPIVYLILAYKILSM